MAKSIKNGKELGRPKYTNITPNDVSATQQVSKIGSAELSNIEKHIKNYAEFVSWARWYPDLFLDLIKPEKGGIVLHLDQRIFMRCILRFVSIYGVFPRGWGKTFDEVLCFMIVAIFFPAIELAVTAQTQESSAKLLDAKYHEIIRYYPMLANEVVKATFPKGEAEIVFANGSIINNLANSESSKGQRRRRIAIEESALLNNVVFDSALKPIVDVPRRTVGALAVVDPEELNQQINFFTTSGFRASYEYTRCLNMAKDMKDLKGVMVLGADWHLACWYGRGMTKAQTLKTKESMSPISFAQNYLSKWCGATDGSLVDIQKLLNTRNLTEAESKGDFNCEYYLGVDVARSIKTGNNLSAVAVVKAIRNPQGRIKECHLVNIFEISNISNFTTQAVEIKKIKRIFNARIICIDTNGLGIGLHDELLKESFDPITGESLGCWDTINTEAVPELQNAERCLYDLKPQSSNSQVITTFIDMVYSGKLRLLIKKNNSEYDIADLQNQRENVLPFVLTDSLIEETANLKLKTLNGGKLGIEMVIKGYNKDKFSALEYVLWYVQTFENSIAIQEEDVSGLLACVIT